MVNYPITFRYNIEKFANAVAYFASKNLPVLDKLKIVKLLYYADKLHLQRYGRPITGDSYYRLGYGPVPTLSLDVIDDAEENQQSYHGIPNSNVKFFLKYLDVDRNRRYPIFSARRRPDLDVFSKSELEAFDQVIEEYGQLSGPELIERSHKEATYIKTPANACIDFRLFLDELNEEEKRALIELLEHDQENREIFDFDRW